MHLHELSVVVHGIICPSYIWLSTVDPQQKLLKSVETMMIEHNIDVVQGYTKR